MFGLAGLRLYGAIAALLVILGFVGWAFRVDHLRAEWRGKFIAKVQAEGKLLARVRVASDNPNLFWRDIADQVDAIAASRKGWKATSQLQTARIDELGMETARLKALNTELRRKAEAAIAKRQAAIERLEDRALTPGERADCARQLREAREALDIAFREGL